MPPLMLASVVSTASFALIPYRYRPLARLGFACSALPIAITGTGNVPLNRRIAAWSVDEPRPEWREVIASWDRWNLLRTCAAVAAFLCEAGAVVS
jgi:uncharacterized membrane protein